MNLARVTGALGAGSVLLLAACGSAVAPAPAAAPTTSVAVTGTLAVTGSIATARATWAVLPMGATSGPNLFWQLFALGSGGTWRLDTPPDIASNGAPALASLSGTALVTGVRPSLHLTYSPLSKTSIGQGWIAGPPAAGLADVPDALAGTTGGGRLLDLSTAGRVSVGSFAGSAWRNLTSQASLAASAAGRACGLTALTAVAYTPTTTPLIAGSCDRPGVAGIFAQSGTSFAAAGPAVPAAYSAEPVRVLRLATAGTQTIALLQVGTRQSAAVLAAWRTASGTWIVSGALPLRGASVRTSALGADGNAGLLLSDGRGAIIGRAGGGWRPVPALPAVSGERAATFAFPAGQQPELLTATAGTMVVWRLTASATTWMRAQTVKVPIQYGSSG